MAIAGGDGSIILTTEVDTSGIRKGTGSINSALASSSKAMKALGNQFDVAMAKGDAKQAQLIMSYQKAAAAVEEQRQKVEGLKAQLESLKSGEIKIQDKGVTKLQTDFDKANASVERMQNEVSKLYAQLDNLQMNAFKDPSTQEPFFTSGEQAEFNEINSKLDELEPKLESAKEKANQLGAELQNAMGAVTQAEIANAEQKITSAEQKMTELGAKAEIAGNKLRDSMSKSINPATAITDSIGKLGDRIFGLAKRVFVFSMITRALRSLRTTFGSVLMSNEGFRNSLAQLQGQLWVAFAPIYSYILPALQSLINFLSLAMSYINQFISLITGKSVASMAAGAQQLKNQADAYKGVGAGASKAAKGMKKTTEEAKKQLAAFDDLQILTDNKSDDADSAGGSGGGGGGAAGGLTPQMEGIEKEISASLLAIMATAGVALVAIGLILLFFGHPVLGIGFIIAGASAFGVAMATLIKGEFVGEISTKLAGIMTIAAVSLIAIGLILLVVGQIAWGIGFIIAGVAIFSVTAIAATKGALASDAKKMLLQIMTIAGGAMLALGIILLLCGVVSPLSIGLIVAGAATLATAVAIDKGAVLNIVQNFFKDHAGLIVGVSLAILVIGIILCCCGIITPLSIGMIVFGAVGLAATLALNFNAIKDKVVQFMKDNQGLIIGIAAALLIIGIILVIAGVTLPLGIGLIVAGAGILATEAALNWEFVKEKVSTTFDATLDWIKASGLLILGIILCVSGIGIPLGISLMKKGGANLTEAQDPVWNLIVDKVKEIWGNIKDFWDNNIKPIFTSEWWLDKGKTAMKGLAQGFQNGINGIITMFENMINTIADKLNQFKINIPDWIPGFGGKSFGFNLNRVSFSRVSLPGLAQGAVIPPNKEFIAVLGDQKQGTNIEAPLQTIVDAFNIALAQNGGTRNGNTEVILEIDGREFGRAVVEQSNKENRRIGTRLVIA